MDSYGQGAAFSHTRRISTTHVSCSIDLCEYVQLSGASMARQRDRIGSVGHFEGHVRHMSQLAILFL